MNIRSGLKAGMAALALTAAPFATKAQHAMPQTLRTVENATAKVRSLAKADTVALDLAKDNSLSLKHVRHLDDNYGGFELSCSQKVTNLGKGTLYTTEGIEAGHGVCTNHGRVSVGVGYNSPETKPFLYGGEVNVYGSADISDKWFEAKTPTWGLTGEGRIGYKTPTNDKLYLYGTSAREFGTGVTSYGAGFRGEFPINKSLLGTADLNYTQVNGYSYNPDFTKGPKGSVGIKWIF